jgi:dolichol-phosphate mannosyltransferase
LQNPVPSAILLTLVWQFRLFKADSASVPRNGASVSSPPCAGPQMSPISPADYTSRGPGSRSASSVGHTTLSVLIPAYHEESTIGEVVRLVLAVPLDSLGIEKEVILVDDGSSDATAIVARRAANGDRRVRIVRHEQNLGKGAAIRTALGFATGDLCLVQDADLEYSVEDYQALIAPILKGADVVYGSRFQERFWPEGMQLPNFIANKMLTLAANLLYGHRLSDEATCFKVFRTKLLRDLDLSCDGFNFCPEVTAKLGLVGIQIVEVPVRYRARSAAAGKKVRWTHGIEALATLVKYRLKRQEPSTWSPLSRSKDGRR